jgi:cyclopropane fatty-acyl-phospholipid synthase-like methyltransferase
MPSPAMTDRADALAERRVGAVTHEWLAAMPDVVARLESMRHPRIADLGCGHGLSTLALAHAFLDPHVDGLDADPASIAVARRHARDAGLDGRVRFLHADATELAGPYDLIVIHEALHDLARPVDALAAARAALATDGTVLVVAAPVLRPPTVRELAGQAGYTRVDVLPVENDSFRLCRLHP